MIAQDFRPAGDATTSPPAPVSLTPALIGSAIVAALGGLLFGFDTAVISGTTEALRAAYRLDDTSLGFTVAIALVGTIVGSIFAGKPADVWGRKKALMVLAILYFVSALGSALAWDWYSFLAFRLLGGLAVGGASVVSPLYIAEISPARFRGRLVAAQQFNVVLGILVAFLSNYLIARMNFGAAEWRWMLGIQVVPSAAFFFLLFPTPESPRWLMARGRVDEARAVLAKLGVDGPGIDEEVADIQRSLDLEHHEGGDSLFQAKYRWPIFLAVAIAMFNQLSGINALMYYAPKIFEMAGAGKDSALLQSVAVGGTNLLFTMLAMTVIDQFGRRKLILIGSVGYLISLGATTWAFYTLRDRVHAGGLGGRAGGPAAVHRGARVRAGGGDLGLHQRDLPEPRPRPGAGPGQHDALGHGGADHLDVPADRQEFRRPCLRLLRRHDVRATALGPVPDARDQGRPPRRDPEEARHPMRPMPRRRPRCVRPS